ncbi:hypothetical protein [Qipengyuania atrilutea]|uniref:Uncharacterized protein n=1 Tax=Qipengyuania atrilutea TaxID=2744473 RepID=A0A850H3U2_9SPHN|nr:hypothetical protein [Actirhodobacter atriluteus]NVD45260.1 hypothetical protein [Actirhodobacter atriluteus]
MVKFSSQFAAVFAALLLTFGSLQAVVTVPPVEAASVIATDITLIV